ncbi:BQ2448_71 [Microbotryum intermedium]|uniref:BQ2448_71 protein n=1 Tax=Microbotryum intermedium TaxID=269621 RepID=A0A238F1E3_9BASI|nr:BQ2448_71 [Microbotryum intermedium]
MGLSSFSLVLTRNIHVHINQNVLQLAQNEGIHGQITHSDEDMNISAPHQLLDTSSLGQPLKSNTSFLAPDEIPSSPRKLWASILFLPGPHAASPSPTPNREPIPMSEIREIALAAWNGGHPGAAEAQLHTDPVERSQAQRIMEMHKAKIDLMLVSKALTVGYLDALYIIELARLVIISLVNGQYFKGPWSIFEGMLTFYPWAITLTECPLWILLLRAQWRSRSIYKLSQKSSSTVVVSASVMTTVDGP